MISYQIANKVKSLWKKINHSIKSSKISAQQLDHIVHNLHVSGELSRLPSQKIKNILYALQMSGAFKTEHLEFVIQNMSTSNELRSFPLPEMQRILQLLHESGHLTYFTSLPNATYNDGYLISFFNADFTKDPRFIKSYELACKTKSWINLDIRWRVYVVCWAAAYAARLEGDFVECGVNRGGYASAVINYVNFKNMKKDFYLLDTFSGFPIENIDLAAKACVDHYQECFDEVVETFKPFKNVKLIKGKVPDTLSQINSNKICYLSIDMNCSEPEIAALNYLWDKLVPGAIIILDDYGCDGDFMRQKTAFDAFALEKNLEILSLPTCQGLIIKP